MFNLAQAGLRKFGLPLFLCITFTSCSFTGDSNPETHINNAKTHIETGDIKSALIELKNALKVESNLPEARWLLGNIYLETGNGIAAHAELSKAQSLGYTDPELSNLLLEALLLQGEYEEVLDKSFTDKEMPVAVQVLRANALLGLKKKDEAENLFRQALDRDNSYIGARSGLIRIALYDGNLEEGAALIEDSLNIDPKAHEVWLLKGQLAYLQNRPEDAEAAFSHAAELSANNVVAYLALTRTLLVQSKIEAAEDSIAFVEAEFPKHPLAKFYRVTGSSNQRVGISPDVQFPSIYSQEDFGEASRENALPWDEIASAGFQPTNTISEELLDHLNALYREDLNTDPDLQKLVRDIEKSRENRNRKSVSLNLETRRADSNDDEEDELTTAVDDSELSDKEIIDEKLKNDPYLKEGLKLLAAIKKYKIG